MKRRNFLSALVAVPMAFKTKLFGPKTFISCDQPILGMAGLPCNRACGHHGPHMFLNKLLERPVSR